MKKGFLFGAALFCVASLVYSHSNRAKGGWNHNFAGEKFRQEMYCPYDHGFCNGFCSPQSSQMEDHARFGATRFCQNGFSKIGQGEFVLGTIKSFDAEQNILEIEDADKQTQKIRINPFTIVTIEKSRISPEKFSPREFVQAENFLQSFKTGIWVAVKKIPSKTVTLDAHRIFIYEK